MAGKYEPLAAHLRAEANQRATQVELTFVQVERLVGDLPPSARRLRTWWANNSHGHALAWRAAGWHVDTVDLAAGRVLFTPGQVGGTRATRSMGPDPRPVPTSDLATSSPPVAVARQLDSVQAHARFTWVDAGTVTLDDVGRLAFPALPATPGLYRLTLTGRPDRDRPQVYIGESDNLRRRSSNYRNPGPSQQTSLRVNLILREHLEAGGWVELATATDADLVSPDGAAGQPLDLTRKAGRLLAENAALVTTWAADAVDVENHG